MVLPNVDLLFSLTSFSKPPLFISGRVDIAKSTLSEPYWIAVTPLGFFPIKTSKFVVGRFHLRKGISLFFNPTPFLRGRVGTTCSPKVLEPSKLETFRQRALFISKLSNFSYSLRLVRTPLLLDTKDIRFPRSGRPFSFPHLREKPFFLPRRFHRLLRNRLIGLNGVISLFTTITFFALSFNFFNSVTAWQIFALRFTTLYFSVIFFFARRLRRFPILGLSLAITKIVFPKSHFYLSSPIRRYSSYTRILTIDTFDAITSYLCFSFQAQLAALPIVPFLHFTQFLKRPRVGPLTKKFSPVLRSVIKK